MRWFDMAKILILCALPEEADAVFAGQGVTLHGTFPLRSLDIGKHDIDVVTCGLGKVNAAMATGMFGADHDLIVMAGTCGALGAAAGRVYWIAEAVQHDYGARLAGAFQRYRGGHWPMGDAGDLHFTAMADPGLDLPHARIASGDSFVACPDAAAEIAASLGATLVDMEVAAVAQCADLMGKPWAAIKAVTDAADGDSGADFHANLLRAAGQAGAAIERLVRRV